MIKDKDIEVEMVEIIFQVFNLIHNIKEIHQVKFVDLNFIMLKI